MLLGVFLCFNAVRIHRNHNALKKLHADAMAAYAAGDYVRSVALLGTYRERTSGQTPDAETEFAYGKSYINVERPGAEHISKGILIFEQYLQSVKPGDATAQRELLRLYVMRGFYGEAVRLADELLAKNPADGPVLEQKVYALSGQRKARAGLGCQSKTE